MEDSSSPLRTMTRAHTFIGFIGSPARKVSLALMRQLPFSLANRHGSRIMKPTRRRTVNGDYADGAENVFLGALTFYATSRTTGKPREDETIAWLIPV